MELITVDSLPTVDVAVETTRAAAAEMRTHAESVLQAGDDLRALESGLPGTPEWVALVSPISPPIAIAADFASGLEQHNRIISADEVENGTVLNEIADQLSTATAGGRP